MDKTINFTVKRIHVSQPQLSLRTIRRWGEPIMVAYGFDVEQAGTTNFQAVKTWNDGNRTWGAVTNFLRIPHNEMLKLRDMQFEEFFEGRLRTKEDKMEWLTHDRGAIYMYENAGDDWTTAPSVRWGTVSLGGNIVQVERYETIELSIGGEPKQYHQMARLKGFGPSDWGKPLQQLINEGLVHVCSCVYRDNAFSWNSPKGRIYSPFFDPNHYDFVGTATPTALYLPTMWLV